MGGEKGRQENDGSADAPHRQLRDGRKRGGRKQNADQRLLCVTWIRVLDGSAVDAIVLMRQRVESKRGNAGGKGEGVFENIKIARAHACRMLARLPSNGFTHPIADAAFCFLFLKVLSNHE